MRNYISVGIMAVSILIASFMFSNAFKNRNKGSNTISVTGSGNKDFTSDLIVWSASFSRKSMELKDANAAIDQDRQQIKTYLIGKGVLDEEIVFSAVNFNKDYRYTYNQNGGTQDQIFTGYSLTQTVTVQSKNVDKTEKISRESSDLINSGIEFYSNAPEYYYTKLAALKIQMIAEGTKDAKTRAQSIADNAGASLGNLKKSDMGVFQITGQNSSEDFTYGGSFNTFSKNKTANITVRLEYEVD